MAEASRKITELRALIGGLEGIQNRDCYRSRHLSCALPKGTLIELTGNQKTEWFLEFLKENDTLNVFWFEKQQTVFPTAIHQRGIGLERIVFGVMEDLYDAARKVIQSQAFQIVALPSVFSDDRTLKTLQLLSEKANATVFLMAQTPQTAWPLHVQLAIHKGERAGALFNIEILKHKSELAR